MNNDTLFYDAKVMIITAKVIENVTKRLTTKKFTDLELKCVILEAVECDEYLILRKLGIEPALFEALNACDIFKVANSMQKFNEYFMNFWLYSEEKKDVSNG